MTAAPNRRDETVELITDLMRTVARGGWQAGRWSASALGTAFEHAVDRAIAPRIRTAVVHGVASGTREESARALRSAREPSVLGQATTSALPRVARRLAPLRAASRRSPAGFALWIGPALTQAVSIGVRELEVIAEHLAAAARSASVAPDADVIQRVAVQVASARPDVASDDAHHRALTLRWMRTATSSLVPFASFGRRSIDDLLDDIAAIDPADLGAPVISGDLED